jgi:hypothetical protein
MHPQPPDPLPGSTSPPRVNPQAAQELIKAYYPALVGSADAARARAQNGYTIAGAVAAAIVAAGVFGDFTSATTLVRVLGSVALGLWLLTALLYVYAVAGRVPWPAGPAGNVHEFSKQVARFAKEGREKVEDRTRWAQLATWAAVLVTAVAILAAVLEPHRSTAVEANILLSPGGASAVSRLCSHSSNVIHGSVEPESLGRSTIAITTVAGQCGSQEATLHLPTRDVVAIAQGGKVAVAAVRRRVVVELTPYGRRTLRRRLGLRCRNDDLNGLVVDGSSVAPTILAFASTNCRRLQMRIPPHLGVVYHLPAHGR